MQRFWDKVDKSGDCWLWTASPSQEYGLFWFEGKYVLAHRFAYELVVGPIPDGLKIDHLCRTTRCVNPSHMEPVTVQVNTLRGIGPAAINAVKEQCHRGHELRGTNLYICPAGKRNCKKCRNISQRKSRQRKKV